MPSSVAHIITGLERGGAEHMLTRLLTDPERDTAIEHRVISLMAGGPLADRLRANGIVVRELGMQRGTPSLISLVRLIRLLRAQRPTLVMSWLYHSDLLGTIVRPLVRRPHLVWNLRRSEPLTPATPYSTRTVVRLLVHLSRCPDVVAANSEAAIVTHRRLGYSPRRWLYLPNGIDLDGWRPSAEERGQVRSELGVADHQRIIVCVARAVPEKDHDTLLESARIFLRQASSATLLLIGRGTELLDLPAEVADRITALGERDDVERLLRGCDIAVLSSVTEGMPNAVAEAMSSGLPAVVTDVGDAARLVERTGIIVDARCPEGLADGVLTLLRMEEEELRALGCRARQRIIEEFSLAASRRAYEDVWRY